MARIGFIGVGMMGHGMAANLQSKGHQVTVMAHRNRAPVDDLVAKGATEVKSLKELAAGQDGIFLCVTASPQVEAVIDAIEPVLTSGQMIVDTSTSRPESTLQLAARLAKKGVRFVDAPLAGGPQHAAAGELTNMVGASEADFAAVLPWLNCTSKTVVRIGETGAGHRAKLINNFMSIGMSALIIEAYRMARDQGIDWQNMFDVNMGGATRSGALERMIPPAIAGNYRGYLFSLANSAKDIGYYIEQLEVAGKDARIAQAVHSYFSEAAAKHGGDAVQSELLKG
jgi:3-hydroxyisobutyrate dehydrogenase-like beta-hydroxyacid dehydrogenase